MRQGRHQIPRIELFTNSLPAQIPDEVMEEISWWDNVQLRNTLNYLGLPLSGGLLTSDERQIRLAILASLVREHGHAIWIQFGYVVEPQRIPIYRAERKGSVADLVEAYRAGREQMMGMARTISDQGCLLAQQGDRLLYSNQLAMAPRKNVSEQAQIAKFYRPGSIVVEGYDRAKGLALLKEQLVRLWRPTKRATPPSTQKDAAAMGIYPMDPSSQAGCLVDIREESILNTMLMSELAATPPTDAWRRLQEQDKVKRVALALPTTSRGLAEGDEPVFLHHLFPSFIRTVTEEELKGHLFTVYIGIDHGDALLDSDASRAAIVGRLVELIGDRPIRVKILQLPNSKRVALLWNLLYLHALREGADYFYQVNDDLTMKTPGWLTYFTTTLDQHDGFGVVGPADHHNGLNCTILTQAMVTPVHFDIFGMLYPVELRDWKSDRWLTYVYQPDDMHCRQDVTADNGGAPTRYHHCEFLSYVIYLEAGKRRIAEWKAARAGAPQ